MGTMNNVSDLGEPDAISDVQRAQEAEEQNKILTDQLKQRVSLVAELDMKNQALEQQLLNLEYDTRMKVADLETRLRRFKKGVRRVMQELARD
jgi:hypothetical protein